MEKIENRKKYMDSYIEFSKTVRLTEKFMELFKGHRYFKNIKRCIEVSK